MNRIFALLVVLLLGWNAAEAKRVTGKVTAADDGSPLPGVNVIEKGTINATTTDATGRYQIDVLNEKSVLVFSFIGMTTLEVPAGANPVIDVSLQPDAMQLSEVVVTGLAGKVGGVRSKREKRADKLGAPYSFHDEPEQQPRWNTEEYDAINENIFHGAKQSPLSTFSIDVDAASYSNLRRYIQNGQQPPIDAVRIEEMVNYFNYNYRQPNNEHPFSVYTEISDAPWNLKHKLVHIGLQGKVIPTENLPASNLVFLIDVSGSMDSPEKLPLVKSSLRMLVQKLRPIDHVAIVVYAGAAGLVLPSTSGEDKRDIINAIDRLNAGGSTAGGQGIKLAYSVARQNFISGGNNRVILATDGDFNVGESSNAAMERLIEQKREDGIFLTVLGYGMGNYKDSKMETLADKGNGNYAYIDTIEEARKVLVSEFGGTMFTIAKDVKLQVEFNPAKVQAYRLIGYENRALKNEDFNNDKKDAGDLGSGHTVTALYEIIPVGVNSEFYSVDPLKYQKTELSSDSKSSELMTIKLRYKQPEGSVSKLITHPVIDAQVKLAQATEDFRWSAAVASFGMMLRNSTYVKGFTYEQVIQLAEGARGKDEEGYRAELIHMVKSMGLLASR